MSTELLDPSHIAIFSVSLIVAGAFAGFIAGLLGVGGGIIVVPALFFILGALGVDEAVRMHVAVGTSLATIIVTSLISARSMRRAARSIWRCCGNGRRASSSAYPSGRALRC